VLGVEDDALKVEEVDALEIWRKMIH